MREDAAYVHIVSNETIHGVEYFDAPDAGGAALVADMSSNILSRPIEVSRYGLIYAGAQKNIGPSGLVIVIVRDDLLSRSAGRVARIFDYAAHAREASLLNTPPTFAWYLAGLVFEWLLEQGGVEAIYQQNLAKASALYDFIDSSDFYHNPITKAHRSLMNVPFTLADTNLEKSFLQQAQAAGLLNLKGHRSVGGMRASIYNAIDLSAVVDLIGFMKQFEQSAL